MSWSSPTVPRCRSCRAELRWARTEKGRRIPLDARPYRDGPEDRLIATVREMLAEHRELLVELGAFEVLECAVAEYDRSFDPRGLFVLRDGGETAVAVPAGAFPGEPLYRSHFATCPNADEHRRSA